MTALGFRITVKSHLEILKQTFCEKRIVRLFRSFRLQRRLNRSHAHTVHIGFCVFIRIRGDHQSAFIAIVAERSPNRRPTTTRSISYAVFPEYSNGVDCAARISRSVSEYPINC